MKRTTILADEELIAEARILAQREGRTFTALLQAALSEYVQAHRRPVALPDFAGMGRSGDGTIAACAEEILGVEIDPHEGWTPGRRTRSPADPSSRRVDEA